MAMLEKRIYLASRSPRRRELLKQIGVGFEMLLLREDPKRTADVDETPLAGEVSAEFAVRIARAKAQAGWLSAAQRRLPRFPVLAADTVVALGPEIIGKPRSAEHAAEILRSLSGTVHEVYTAVAVAFEDQVEARLSRSAVEFRELDEQDIRRYVATGEPMDKAGAYGIQGRAAVFVSNICGSYTGIMGLPLFETAALLAKFGVEPL